jgi:hypothetical protein
MDLPTLNDKVVYLEGVGQKKHTGKDAEADEEVVCLTKGIEVGAPMASVVMTGCQGISLASHLASVTRVSQEIRVEGRRYSLPSGRPGHCEDAPCLGVGPFGFTSDGSGR